MIKRFCVLMMISAMGLGTLALADGGPITMAVTDPMALENACPCVKGYAQRDYRSLARHIGAALGRPVEVKFSESLHAIVQKMGRMPEIVIGNKTLAEYEAKEANLKLTQLALLSDSQGSTEFNGLFVVRTKDPLNSLADLKGKKIVFGPIDRDEKWALAKEALAAAGIDVEKEPRRAETCNVGATAVAKGEADAAVISSYAMPLVVGCQAVAKGELKVIGQTRSIPFVAAFASDTLSLADAATLSKALESVAADADLLKKMESKNGFVMGGK